MSVQQTFNGRSVLVTGAASGIGRSIAQQCARAGAYVLLTDVDDSVHAVASEIAGADAIVVDVTAPDQLQAAIDHVVERHGSLDFIFNNAGVAVFGEVELLTLEDLDRTIDVNLRAVAHGTKLAYDQMVRQGGGHIVNTASAAGLVPVPLQTHYCTTKHGVVGLGKTLSLEGERHNVRVTTFCPGFVRTGMATNNTLRGSMDVPDLSKLLPVKAISADEAVACLLSGVARGKLIVVTPWYARIGSWFERFSPRLSHRLHRRFFRLAGKRAAKAKR